MRRVAPPEAARHPLRDDALEPQAAGVAEYRLKVHAVAEQRRHGALNDETVDLVLHREGEEAPLAMRSTGCRLRRLCKAVLDQWSLSQPGSVLIIRDGPEITSFDDILTIYNREDFPRAPKARADPAADR